VPCAGIAAADGNRVGAAAQRVVAEIGSSKLIAGVSTVLANSPRYRGCSGCRLAQHIARGGAAAADPIIPPGSGIYFSH
jgi:hypothetical protein